MRGFKFLIGYIPSPRRYFGLTPGALHWMGHLNNILYYLEEEIPYGLIRLNTKSQFITMYYESYNSFDDFMTSNRDNLILIFNIIDDNGNVYTQNGLHLLDHSKPIIVTLYTIKIEPHDRINQEGIPAPSHNYTIAY